MKKQANNTNNIKELIDFLNKYKQTFTVKNNKVIADTIDLSNNKISSLPESIGNLKCHTINLNNNNISSLPESIENLKCNTIYLYSNNISSLPESIENLKCNTIYLSYNKISSLPESISNLKCHTINLSNNNLSSLPESIGNLKCHTIYLNNNNISSLPESISNLKCNYIDLSSNNISSLPESIGNLKCNTIDLSDNKISSIPNTNTFDSIDITNDYIFCDGILFWYDKKKLLDGYTLYVNHYGCVATKDNKVFAHGKDSRSAISDLEFKIASELFKNKPIKMTDKIGVMEYRAITGACDSGIRDWMDKHKFDYTIRDKRTVEKEKVVVKELLSLLEQDGAYGVKRLKELIKG